MLCNENSKVEVIKIEDILNRDIESAQHIVIQGESGSGKSTLMTKLAYTWAEQIKSKKSRYELLLNINLKFF